MQKTPEELKKMYESVAYVQMYDGKPISRLARLRKHFALQDNMDVVDYACGNGFLLPLVHSDINSYTGVDYSAPLIASARARATAFKIANARFIVGDLHDFSRAHHDRFDVAFAMDFSEHVLDEDWLDMLRSIHASLKKNGVLYLHTPNRDFILETLKDRGMLINQLPGHIAVRNADGNVRLLGAANFTDIQVTYVPHYNILRFIHFFSYLPLVGKYFRARLLIAAKKTDQK